jgi:hypothetical protein
MLLMFVLAVFTTVGVALLRRGQRFDCVELINSAWMAVTALMAIVAALFCAGVCQTRRSIINSMI